MAIDITIRIKGTRASVVAAIRRAVSRNPSDSGPLKVLLVRTGLALLQQVHAAYAVKAQGGTDDCGTRWAPLAPSTVRRRKRRPSYRTHGGILILRDTDDLWNSLAAGCEPRQGTQTPPAVPGQVFRLDASSAVVGSKIPYAHFHQAGIPGRMPARPPLPDVARFPAKWWDAILDEARLAVIEMLKTELAR